MATINKIKEYLKYAELANAGYVFEKLFEIEEINNETIKYEDLNKEEKLDKLKRFLIQERGYSTIQAENFVNNYEYGVDIVKFEAQSSYEYFKSKNMEPSPAGFQAVIFKQGEEYILSFAGTNPLELGDILSDINLIQEKIVAQFEYLVEYVNYVKSIIPKGQQITVSGHSLGGALAQMATATFPDLIKQTYTYNSPGAKNLNIPEIYEENGAYFRKDYENIFGVEKLVTTEITKNLYDAYNLYKNNNSLESVNQKVINIRGEDAFGAGITELGEDIGSDGIEFFINTDNALVNVPAHSVSTLEKSLYFYATLMTIDSSLDSETITQEMVKFKNNYTNSTNIISNDLTIFDNYLNRISDLFNNEISYEKNQENGNSVVDFYIEFTKSEFNQYKNLNLEFLTTKTQTQLQDKTLANLYALENLNPFVIEGDFEAYNNIDVSKYTDQYLEDRATYLYYLLDKKNRYDIDPTLSMTAYEDVELGSEYTLEQFFSKSKIVFGGDSDNILIGGDGSDRLYAGLGNDTV